MGVWSSRRDFQGVREGWKAGFLASHPLSFPRSALKRVSQNHNHHEDPVWGEHEPLARDGDYPIDEERV